jgi:hypothetical protein
MLRTALVAVAARATASFAIVAAVAIPPFGTSTAHAPTTKTALAVAVETILPAITQPELEPAAEHLVSALVVPIHLYMGGTGKNIATIEFWYELAWCETHRDWRHYGGVYNGGLGIYDGTWKHWGGTEFAPTARDASIAEQIVVANRISTQGWQPVGKKFREPVWFGGWGALPCVGKPSLVSLGSPQAYMPEQLLFMMVSPYGPRQP